MGQNSCDCGRPLKVKNLDSKVEGVGMSSHPYCDKCDDLNGHKLLKHRGGCPEAERGMSCMFCDGGLASCVICGGGEGSLPINCPGVRMTADQHDAVYAGQIDFIEGTWVKQTKGHNIIAEPGAQKQCLDCWSKGKELAFECPKRPMTEQQRTLVHDGLLDYRGGKWIDLPPYATGGE